MAIKKKGMTIKKGEYSYLKSGLRIVIPFFLFIFLKYLFIKIFRFFSSIYSMINIYFSAFVNNIFIFYLIKLLIQYFSTSINLSIEIFHKNIS